MECARWYRLLCTYASVHSPIPPSCAEVWTVMSIVDTDFKSQLGGGGWVHLSRKYRLNKLA